MDWKTPRTWADGEIVSFAQLNEQLRDNLNYLKQRADTVVNNQLGAQVRNSADQTVTSGDAITFDTEVWDTDSMHSTVSNTSRLTCNTKGVYMIYGFLWFNENPGGTKYIKLSLYKNGSEIENVKVYLLNTMYHTPYINTILRLEANDYLELKVSHDLAAPITSKAYGGADNVLSPVFTAQRIGD